VTRSEPLSRAKRDLSLKGEVKFREAPSPLEGEGWGEGKKIVRKTEIAFEIAV
jgi:hypothetical protein